MAKANRNFLSQATSLMLNTGDLELASYFTRKLQESEIKAECNSSGLLGPLTPTPSKQSSRKTTSKKKIHHSEHGDEFPGYFCRVCGKLQNPLLVRFRVRPKICRRKGTKKNVANCNSNGEQQKCRNPKYARKHPFVSSKCYFCNQQQKLVCHPPVDKSERRSVSGKTICSGKLLRKSSRCISDKETALTPKKGSKVHSTSSSNRKKRKSINSPLANLLFAAKKETPDPPNLKSFLFKS